MCIQLPYPHNKISLTPIYKSLSLDLSRFLILSTLVNPYFLSQFWLMLFHNLKLSPDAMGLKTKEIISIVGIKSTEIYFLLLTSSFPLNLNSIINLFISTSIFKTPLVEFLMKLIALYESFIY